MLSTRKAKKQKTSEDSGDLLKPLLAYYYDDDDDDGDDDETERTLNGHPPRSTMIMFTPVLHSISNENLKQLLAIFAMEKPGTEYVLTFDIEKSGENPKENFMPAIGGAVQRVKDRKVMSEIRIFMKPEDGKCYSDHCWKEYWTDWKRFPKNKQMLASFEKYAIPPEEGIRKFAAWLDTNERKYENLVVANDCPSSDCLWISLYFQTFLGRLPISNQYGDETRHRRIHQTNAFARSLSWDDGSGGEWRNRLKAMGLILPPDDLHDHDPVNDAKAMGLLYIASILYVRQMRKQILTSLQYNKEGRKILE